MRKTILTDNEQHDLHFNLTIAALRFEADAEDAKKAAAHKDNTANQRQNFERLAAQFTKQAEEARALAERIQDADTITITVAS